MTAAVRKPKRGRPSCSTSPIERPSSGGRMLTELSSLLALFVLTWIERNRSAPRRPLYLTLSVATIIMALVILVHGLFLTVAQARFLDQSHHATGVQPVHSSAPLVVSRKQGGDFVIYYEYLGPRKV